MRISIEGHSDDTIGAYGLPSEFYSLQSGQDGAMDDYDTCANNKPPMTFDIIAPTEGRLRVTCVYNGCWSFAIGLVDEDDPTPGFLDRLRIVRDGYSMNVELDVPDDTCVVWNDKSRR